MTLVIDIHAGLAASAATALLVGSRAFQQLNVTRGHVLAAALTPFAIAAGEIAVVGAIVVSGWAAWPWIGAGGAIGAVGAMALHRRTIGKRSSTGANHSPGAKNMVAIINPSRGTK